MSNVKTEAEIEAMRRSGAILAEVYEVLRPQLVRGVTAKDIAAMAKSEIESRGAQAVLLGYQNFPDVICTSFNEQVVHGIPTDRELVDGDLISLDMCVGYEGMITDSAFTTVVGGEAQVKARTRILLQATEQALYHGIEQVRPGARIGDISHAIQRRLLRDDLGVIEKLVGHGVGHQVHEDPEVPNFGIAGRGPTLKPGMTIAIEPMATLGGKEVYTEADGWTITSQDRSLSAHFEHTVAVTEDGYEILTRT